LKTDEIEHDASDTQRDDYNCEIPCDRFKTNYKQMKTKLTLTIEKNIIEKAKEFARNSGKSLSDLVERFLEKEIAEVEIQQANIPEEFKGLFGSVNLPADLNEKEAIREILSEKHQK